MYVNLALQRVSSNSHLAVETGHTSSTSKHPQQQPVHLGLLYTAHHCILICPTGDTVDYVVTGSWSKKAYEEAQKFGLNVNLTAKGDNKSVPPRDSWKLSPDAKYVHYCDNETIGGVTCCYARCWTLCMCIATWSGLRNAA